MANDEWRASCENRGAHEITDQFYDTQTIGTQTAMVRGQTTILRLHEGFDKHSQTMKQLVCMLTGKSGEILLVMVASQATWDQAMVEARYCMMWEGPVALKASCTWLEMHVSTPSKMPARKEGTQLSRKNYVFY